LQKVKPHAGMAAWYFRPKYNGVSGFTKIKSDSNALEEFS
jgi:hypothetical protein